MESCVYRFLSQRKTVLLGDHFSWKHLISHTSLHGPFDFSTQASTGFLLRSVNPNQKETWLSRKVGGPELKINHSNTKLHNLWTYLLARKQGEKAEHKPEHFIPILSLTLPHRTYIYLQKHWLMGPWLTYFPLYAFLQLPQFFTISTFIIQKRF